MKIWSSVLLIC